jgi:hypothetical protein
MIGKLIGAVNFAGAGNAGLSAFTIPIRFMERTA